MKPALCIVNPYEHGGGAEYQISLLVDALCAQNAYDLYYLAHFLDARERVRGYRVMRIGSGAGIPALGYLQDTRALYRLLSAIAPRVIYQRVACAYTGICAIYSRRHGIPLLWHVAHDSDVSVHSLDPGRNVLRVRLERWAVNFGARRADHVIVQTHHQASLLRKNFNRTATAIIPNFHPPAEETLDKSGDVTVVWVANLKPWKRPEVFARLAAQLRNRSGVKFLMIGAPAGAGGNQAWQDDLMREIGAAPNLQYLGHKSHTEVNQLLARAHIFVNTSTAEGFPNTFIQAWLRDVVVVSLSVDPDGVLEQKGVGILARSEAALSDAVRGLLDDPVARRAYAARGREHAIARHSLRNAGDLVRLIDRARDGTA